MADKLLMVMMNADPRSAMEVVPPISQATIAAAMEFEVEIIFSGRTAELVKPGIAASIAANKGSSKTVLDLLRDAVAAGVKIKVCALGLQYWGEEVIAEVCETVGDAYIISEAMDSDTVTFNY